MGRTVTPKYAVELGGFLRMRNFTSAWRGRVPSVAQLERYVMEYVVSTMPGYCNERIGQAYGITIPSYAMVKVNRADGATLVQWKAPMFMVLPNPADYPRVAKVVPRVAHVEAAKENIR